jgi:hypothetical protein
LFLHLQLTVSILLQTGQQHTQKTRLCSSNRSQTHHRDDTFASTVEPRAPSHRDIHLSVPNQQYTSPSRDHLSYLTLESPPFPHRIANQSSISYPLSASGSPPFNIAKAMAAAAVTQDPNLLVPRFLPFSHRINKIQSGEMAERSKAPA